MSGPNPFIEPTRGSKAFNCPRCGAYAQQEWFKVYRKGNGNIIVDMKTLGVSRCTHCEKSLIWNNDSVIVPDVSSAPPPNGDLDKDIQDDYGEAAWIAAKSTRGAAGLLRLCIQKLCKQLGESGKNIDQDIGSLVKKGLDVRIQQSLDTVRVIGNEAVHPGEMDLRDDADTVGMLFTLVNAIANDMITQPRLRDELYKKLPKSKLDGIAARDAKPKA